MRTRFTRLRPPTRRCGLDRRQGAADAAGPARAPWATAPTAVRRFIIIAVSIVAVIVTAVISNAATSSSPAADVAYRALPWPEGTTLLGFEDIEGAILVRGRLQGRSGRDTAGPLIVDTGAGFLGLDLPLSRWLGISDPARPPDGPIGVADRPLARLELGDWQVDQVSPILTVDGRVMSRVTGRPVLGLVGQALFADRVLVVDYPAATLAVLPAGMTPGGSEAALRRVLSPAAVPVRFLLAGDGKAVLDAWVGSGGRTPSRIRLVLDTGATKTVLFRGALDRAFPGWRRWPRLRGLGAPTLTGDAAAEMTRIPTLRVGPRSGGVVLRGMDSAVLGGELETVISAAVGEPVAGLLGYSFLKHYRVAVDYPRRTLWLDPERGDLPDRPHEYSHPGVQLEADAGRLLVYSVVSASPAARAGLRKGDQVVAIDGRKVAASDLARAVRSLEGPPASVVRITLRRSAREWSVALVRRRLL